MTGITLKELGSDREKKLLESFSIAAFGTECRTDAFIDIDDDMEVVSFHAEQGSNGRWTVTRHTTLLKEEESGVELMSDPPQKVMVLSEQVKQSTVKEDLAFFDAIRYLAAFEKAQLDSGNTQVEDEDYANPVEHYTVFGVKEGIAFDIDGQPHMTDNGKIITDGIFTNTMRQDVKTAFEEKSALFFLPVTNLSRSLQSRLSATLTAENVLNASKSKEVINEFIDLFDKYIDLYKKSAAKKFQDADKNALVVSLHDEIEEHIEKMPDDAWPSKREIKNLVATAHIYFSLQAMQAQFGDKLKDSGSAKFLEETAMPKMQKLSSYHERMIGGSLPIGRMLAFIINTNNKIDGIPPRDIQSAMGIMKTWQQVMKTGRIDDSLRKKLAI